MNKILTDLTESKLSNKLMNKYKSQNTLEILKTALEIQQKTNDVGKLISRSIAAYSRSFHFQPIYILIHY